MITWHDVEGKWGEVSGMVKQKWERLTDEELRAVRGKREVLLHKLQEHYGYAKERAERELDGFLRKCRLPRMRREQQESQHQEKH